MYSELAIFVVFAFLYSAVAGRLERSPVSGPVVFILGGLILGPVGLGWLDFEISETELRLLADLTLALVLFIDAANVNMKVLVRNMGLPQRMLLFGLPGVILLGIGTGMLLFGDLGFYTVATLAVMLAATDAALGKAVVTNKLVPPRVREGLNAESGLNDGICVPILFVFIALATQGGKVEGGGTALALKLFIQELGIGLLVGLGMAAAGAWLLDVASKRGWITNIWIQVPVITLALGAFAVAQTLHGSGYIAAFVGGLLFGRLAGHLTHDLVLPAEGAAELLGMLTWVAFGAAALPQVLEHFTWEVMVYALLSLTVVRVLPIYISLVGTGERIETRLFMAWFGPRGLASIAFVVIAWNKGLPGADKLVVVVFCTVFLSALAHGLTANPFSKALATRLQGDDGEASQPGR
ncbi:MAG: cation:proton antiporter [Verrucomicrobiales bacterium]